MHHSGYVSNLSGGFCPSKGYKAEGIARREMIRLVKSQNTWNKEWAEKRPEWIDEYEFRIEAH